MEKTKKISASTTKDANAWMNSAEGRSTLKKALENANKTVKELSAARFIDQQIMSLPLSL